MSTVAEPQIGMDEKIVDSTEIEGILEEREKAREKAAMAKSTLKGFDERARSMLDEHLTEDEAVLRVGRFRIMKSKSKSRSVSFTTEPGTRVRIVADD